MTLGILTTMLAQPNWQFIAEN